jgi:hypothetical protein
MKYGAVVELVAEEADVDRKTAKAVLDALSRVVPREIFSIAGGVGYMPIPKLGAFVLRKGSRSIVPGKGEVKGKARVGFKAFEGAKARS